MTNDSHPADDDITPRNDAERAIVEACHRATPAERESMLYDAIARTTRPHRYPSDTLPPKR